LAILVVCISGLWLVVLSFSYPPELFATYGFVAEKPRAVSLISSMFLHPSIIFLLPNMIFLSILGKQLEDALGRMLFLGVFRESRERQETLFSMYWIALRQFHVPDRLGPLPESSQHFGWYSQTPFLTQRYISGGGTPRPLLQKPSLRLVRG
jgi:hypothetical protein